jgi:3-deoxy-D-manno-octulosonic-acid transferase
MELLYHSIIAGAILAASPYFFLRALTDPAFRKDLGQRLRSAQAIEPRRESVWVHASSVGEVRAAAPLLRALRDRPGCPPTVISTFTAGGRATADAEGLSPVFRLPPDLPWWTGPLLNRLKPRLLILIEAEFWPGLLHQCHKQNIPVLLVNGRISEKSCRRYAKIKPLFRWMTAPVNLFSMRSTADAERAQRLGIAEQKIRVTGNLKFDAVADTPNGDVPPCNAIRPPLLTFGSTRPGDEEPILDAVRRLRADHPGLRCVLAPRHLQRCAEVESLMRDRGFACKRLSTLGSPEEEACAEMILVDRMGELNRFYGKSSAAFVGGGFDPRWGGQNILEPALLRRPVVFGPHMDNFADEARLLVESGGGIQVRSAGELHTALHQLLSDPHDLLRRGDRAWQTLQEHRGAVRKNLDLIDSLLRKRI